MDPTQLTQKGFEYFGALAFCGVGLVVALIFVVRQWLAALRVNEQMWKDRLAETVAQGDEQAKAAEAMRTATNANTMALQANTEIMKLAVSRLQGDQR